MSVRPKINRSHLMFWKRQYLIDPKFQGNFILFMIFASLAILGVLYVTNILWLWKFYMIGDSLDMPHHFDFEAFMREQFTLMNTFFISTCAMVFVILGMTSLILSHRIAGPLFRLKRHMENTVGKIQSKEQLDLVEFRKADYFHDLAKAYNQQIEMINHLKVEHTHKTGDTNLVILTHPEPVPLKKAS